MTSREIDVLRRELRRSVYGPAWHGPALLEALEGLTPADAARRVHARAHTASEILLHCVAWTEEVTERLRGREPALPARGDWPAPPELGSAAWAALRRELEAATADLDRELEGFPAERLDQRIGGPGRDPPLGSGVSFREMLHGLAQHNAYHGGQIALLRRVLRGAGGGPETLAPLSQ